MDFKTFETDLRWYINEILIDKSNTGTIYEASEYFVSLNETQQLAFIQKAHSISKDHITMYDVIIKTATIMKNAQSL